MSAADVLRLVFPILLVAAGLAMLFAPGWFSEASRRQHEARLAERAARGEDAYFEELRELKAYPPARTVYAWQALGFLLSLLGTFLIFDRVTT